jgi:hypothetical protein
MLWARSPTGAHMKSLSQLAMTPPYELTIEEILRDRIALLRDRIALQRAKQHGYDEIEPENQAADRKRTVTESPATGSESTKR